MTQEQRDFIDEAISYVRGARDVLELHERRLSDFGDVKVDPSDPYSLTVDDAASGLSVARDTLNDTLDILLTLSNLKSEVK